MYKSNRHAHPDQAGQQRGRSLLSFPEAATGHHWHWRACGWGRGGAVGVLQGWEEEEEVANESKRPRWRENGDLDRNGGACLERECVRLVMGMVVCVGGYGCAPASMRRPPMELHLHLAHWAAAAETTSRTPHDVMQGASTHRLCCAYAGGHRPVGVNLIRLRAARVPGSLGGARTPQSTATLDARWGAPARPCRGPPLHSSPVALLSAASTLLLPQPFAILQDTAPKCQQAPAAAARGSSKPCCN